MHPQGKTKKITTLALLGAVAFVLSWVDSLIPVSGVLPGAKLGLSNLAVLMGLYLLGAKAGGCLCLVKILLSTFLFGNAFSFFYALAGGVLSFFVMLLLKHHSSMVFVSILGGACHNLGQIAVAAVILQTTGLMAYLPVLLLCGLGSGFAVGLLGELLLGRIKKILSLGTNRE